MNQPTIEFETTEQARAYLHLKLQSSEPQTPSDICLMCLVAALEYGKEQKANNPNWKKEIEIIRRRADGIFTNEDNEYCRSRCDYGY